MRLIRTVKILDPLTFEPKGKVTVRNDDGTVYTFDWEIKINKYTPQEQFTIDEVNKVLFDNKQELMTEDEMEFLLFPGGRPAFDSEPTEEELQRLAGFRVVKEIIPTDGVKEKEVK